jgi:hypothetical protein
LILPRKFVDARERVKWVLYLEIELFLAFVYYRNISIEYIKQGPNILYLIEFLSMSAAIRTFMESDILFPLMRLLNAIHTLLPKIQEVSFEWYYRKWMKATGILRFWNRVLFVPWEDSWLIHFAKHYSTDGLKSVMRVEHLVDALVGLSGREQVTFVIKKCRMKLWAEFVWLH